MKSLVGDFQAPQSISKDNENGAERVCLSVLRIKENLISSSQIIVPYSRSLVLCYKTELVHAFSCESIELWMYLGVCRALEKLQLLSATPRATIMLLS